MTELLRRKKKFTWSWRPAGKEEDEKKVFQDVRSKMFSEETNAEQLTAQNQVSRLASRSNQFIRCRWERNCAAAWPRRIPAPGMRALTAESSRT